ncbi:tail fiber domain-containing protein [Escherichia coli]|nr:tail fiber domain-containing protein [Escherichia coli]
MAWVSPEMYGALETESDADTQAVIDAFITAKTMGLAVKLSRIYKCDQNISVANFYGDIFGVSMATCGIKFAAGYGLIIDNSGTTVVRKPVGLCNFTIKATGKRQGTALEFLGTGGIAYARQLIVRDLDVSNDAGTPTSFDVVFKLNRAGQCVFDGVNVAGGGTSDPNARMGKIFDLYSTKNINVVNGSYQNFDTFMYAHDDTEGVVVFGNHIIAGRRGVVSENNVGNLFQVTNNHFNTSLSAVELGDLSNNGGNHSIITDNFCMVWNGIPEDDTTPYIGFKSCAMYGTYSDNEVLLSGFTKDVTHTLFTSNATGTRTAQYNIVSNPRVNNCTRGIHMLAGTQSNHVSNVQRVGVTLANAIIDEGANNRSWMFDVDNNAFMTRNIKLCTPGSAVAQQIRFYSATDANTPSAILRVSGGVAGVGGDGTAELTAGTTVFKNIRPSAANTYSCGSSGAPWSGGFTQTAFTVTSDADYKSDPLLMTDDILDAAEEVQLVQYQYLDRIEEKGADGARWHFGAIAQRYVEAFERHGLDAHRFGFICYDEWGDAPAVIDEDTGEVITPAIEAGSRYGIRYEEMLVMEAALQRRNYARLLDKYETLEARISSLENK